MKTVSGVRLAPAGFHFPSPDPPIRQAQRPAATQKIDNSFLRLLRLFAATVLMAQTR
jgi:hypothetical protein